jgi:hypothetical protein
MEAVTFGPGMDSISLRGWEDPVAPREEWSVAVKVDPGAPRFTDPVNHPPHYTWLPGGVEVIDITQHLNFCLGNAVKYILRCDQKGSPEQDLRKAIWYLERELKRRAPPA